MSKLVSRFVKNEDGATAIEYGLIATFIAIAIIGVAQAVGNDIVAMFQAVADAI